MITSVTLVNLKDICISKGIDSIKLSEMTGICLKGISRYMNRGTCSIKNANNIAAILNVNLSELKGVEINTPKVIEYNTLCQNQACPLNSDCICRNDIVLTGKGSCAGKDLIKDKPKKVNYRNTRGITKNNFKRSSRKELRAVYEV